jgi:hypothetical protein
MTLEYQFFKYGRHFAIQWGIFVYARSLLVCVIPRIFSKLEIHIFQKYLHGTMEVVLDDFAVYNTRKKHTRHLQ